LLRCCCHFAKFVLFAGEVIQLKADAGKTFSSAELKAAVAQHKPAILFLVQGESSTGTHQALGDGLGEACKAAGTLLVVDTVSMCRCYVLMSSVSDNVAVDGTRRWVTARETPARRSIHSW
jgi:aspartate aminotransferase-like enzyme